MATTSYSQTHDYELANFFEKCRRSEDCMVVLRNMLEYEIDFSGKEISYSEFLANPQHSFFYRAIVSKNIDPSKLYLIYKYKFGFDVDLFVEYLLK